MEYVTEKEYKNIEGLTIHGRYYLCDCGTTIFYNKEDIITKNNKDYIECPYCGKKINVNKKDFVYSLKYFMFGDKIQ